MADANATAKLCCRCLNWKPRDSFYNNKRSKTGHCAACKLCMDFARAQWISANPEKAAEVSRNARLKHKVARDAQIKAWGIANRERRNETRKAWRELNREKDCGYTKKWQAANKSKVNAICAGRHSRKLQATPAWANQFFIDEAYHLAKLREAVCGGEWQVDHIVPLRGKLVCGLHVENNLSVIPAIDNRRKSNRHWPDMP